jgi:hypothetical protein
MLIITRKKVYNILQAGRDGMAVDQHKAK